MCLDPLEVSVFDAQITSNYHKKWNSTFMQAEL